MAPRAPLQLGDSPRPRYRSRQREQRPPAGEPGTSSGDLEPLIPCSARALRAPRPRQQQHPRPKPPEVSPPPSVQKRPKKRGAAGENRSIAPATPCSKAPAKPGRQECYFQPPKDPKTDKIRLPWGRGHPGWTPCRSPKAEGNAQWGCGEEMLQNQQDTTSLFVPNNYWGGQIIPSAPQGRRPALPSAPRAGKTSETQG